MQNIRMRFVPKYTIDDMQEIAKAKGGRCLSLEYKNTYTPLTWQCNRGHTWDTTPSIVKQGGWCVQCYKEEYKEEQLEELWQLAASKNGQCLSDRYINSKQKLKWECDKGHIWETAPGRIKRGNWCPACANEKRRGTIEQMQQVAASREGKCLSDKYINCETKLKWQCGKGHVWEATPSAVKSGSWCHVCANVVKGTIEQMQEIAKSRGGKCLSKKYVNNHVGLKWECSKGHRWKAVPKSIKQGCWCSVCAGVAKLTLGDMKELARSKGGKCLSSKYINSSKKLKWQCSKGHVWESLPGGIKSGNWCPVCGHRVKGTIEQMRAIAESRGGKCLSTKYFNINTKLRWQCKERHQWSAIPATIKKGHWCPVCGGNAKLTLEDMEELAGSRGGKCLSSKYINIETKLKWQCSKGHVWEASPVGVKRGNWCPVCSQRAKGTIEQMHTIAEGRGGKCLSPQYINSHTKLRWQCDKRHQWKAVPYSIKQGHWCPVCAGKVNS